AAVERRPVLEPDRLGDPQQRLGEPVARLLLPTTWLGGHRPLHPKGTLRHDLADRSPSVAYRIARRASSTSRAGPLPGSTIIARRGRWEIAPRPRTGVHP